MKKKDSLGDRMKENYESRYKVKLPTRMPVIIRLDGKAFHTLTKRLNLEKPFDDTFITCMDRTATELCKQIQGVQMAYVQSDEISLFLHNYKKLQTQPWFDNELQKMVSISAAFASVEFSFQVNMRFPEYPGGGLFDSRVFVLPEAEVNNYFAWRQQDNTRNSVQMLARSLYSHKECNNKNNSQLQEMSFQKGQNWDKLETRYKRGRCIIKDENGKWIVDNEIPIFTKDREYINKLLKTEDE